MRENTAQAVLDVRVLAAAFARAQRSHGVVAVARLDKERSAVHHPFAHLGELFYTQSLEK